MRFTIDELDLILHLCAEAQDYAEHGFTAEDLRDWEWLDRMCRVAALKEKLHEEGGLKI